MPKYSGDVMKFSQFWQQFEACVDNQEMPAVTKFNVLLGLLNGDARNLLEGLPVTEELRQRKGPTAEAFGEEASRHLCPCTGPVEAGNTRGIQFIETLAVL